jgi:hypothetical protein
MKRIGWSSLALVLMLAIGLVPVFDTNAQTRNQGSSSAEEAAVVEVVTFNCTTEPPKDGSLATEFPDDCAEGAWVYSGTIIDPSGIIVTSHMAALAEPENNEKFGWQMIGFKQEGEEKPLFAVVAQPIAYDQTLGIAMLYPVFMMDGSPIEEGDLNLPSVRLANGGMSRGDAITMTGWDVGETSNEDHLSSVETTIDDLRGDQNVSEFEDAGWYYSEVQICCAMNGGAGFNGQGRLAATVGITVDDDTGTWMRPMPETLEILTGQDLTTPEEPAEQSVETPEAQPRKPREQAEGTATLIGTVVSADTSEPIPGAVVLIINPGISLDEALSTEDPGVVYGGAETDGNGDFRIDPPVVKGEKYGVAFIADGYNVIGGENLELAPADSGDVVDLGEIALSSQ